MPVLHSYRNKEGFYVLAGVNGRIVTYRLSAEGASRLQENSVNDNDKFSWQILLELIRQGDAFTNTSGSDDEDLSGWTQLGLVFNIQDNEPSFSDPVPICGCGSMEELHIAELPDSKTATMLCRQCRADRRNEIEACIPIYLINTNTTLERLLERSGLTADKTVKAYQLLLNSKLASKWKSKSRPKSKSVQNGLFSAPEKPQQSLF